MLRDPFFWALLGVTILELAVIFVVAVLDISSFLGGTEE
jgi:hypothetical protein